MRSCCYFRLSVIIILYRFQGQREEGANYNITLPVCVELPVVSSHGSTQPDDGSCIRDSATVYLQPMHTKVVFAHTAVMLLSCRVLQVVCDHRRLEPLDLSSLRSLIGFLQTSLADTFYSLVVYKLKT